MALDRQLLAPMIHTIVVEHCTGASAYGRRTYTSASTFKARIEFKRRTVKDAQARDVISTSTIFTPPYDVNGTAASIGNSDRITLPVVFSTTLQSQPPIISVEPHYDHQGAHHLEVYI